ncbi:Hypothetical protein GLP15_3428 [Giardia lamblia P15]|uniref:Chromosome segregation protein SMC n=1 Tax=Giardia intestinalis (strain P15) TaxID=658858 RepID=E1F3J8_GIAIA|nr:Hypothetical protein GLP15_3428 [Giardia lamblia P15]
MTTDPLGLNMTELGIVIDHDELQHVCSNCLKYTPEAMALVNELTTNITTILTDSITAVFTALKASIHERPLYVLFEPQLGCDPLTDHQAPKDVYPVFSEAISSAEKKLSETSIAMIADELRAKIVTMLNLEVSKTSALKAQAEDALSELASLKAKLLMKDKFIQQIMQSKSEDHSKLISEITVLREQAFMKRRFGDRYKPDNIEKAVDEGQQQGLGGSLLGSTGEFTVGQGNQANKLIRDQLAATVAENKELKLKLEATGLAHKKLEELEEECTALRLNIQTLESSHIETIAKLESSLKEKTLLISTYQDNERALNMSVQELTKQLRSLEKKRPTSSDITSRTDTDLFRENTELKTKVFELQEQLMTNQLEKKQDSAEDTNLAETLLNLQKELQEKIAEANSYRQKLEEAGLLNAPIEAFIKLSDHNIAVAALNSQIGELEAQNQDLIELSEKLQRQVDQLIENEAIEINNVLEANEILHKQKLKNAVEAAVCIDSFNESIQAAKRAITNFDDFGCQVPDKRARKSALRSGEGDDLDIQDDEGCREDAEASRIRRAIDAARKIYANRLPTINEPALSYDVSSVDEVFKQLFDTAKTAKTQLMKKHHETLQSEAQTLMRNLNLHDRIARTISNYTNFVDQPPKDPLKLLSKEQLRDVLCEDIDIGPLDDSSLEQDETLAGVPNAPHEKQDKALNRDLIVKEPHDSPPAKPDGPAPRSRKRRASPSKVKSGRSTLSTPISSTTRPTTRKSGTMLSGTTTSHASEVEELDGEKDFFRASVPNSPVRETFNVRASASRGVESDSDSDSQMTYALTDNGKRMALIKCVRAPRLKSSGRGPRLLIRLLKDKLTGEVRDELGRLVSVENLYMYGYCLDSRGDLVYYGDCSINKKASDDPDTIIRKFLADDEGELLLPNGQRISREDALRFGYKGPARNGTYIFIGQPLDLYEQVMRLSPDGVSAMVAKVLGQDIEYNDVIADFTLKLDLDEVTQKPYVYIDNDVTSLQGSAQDTSHIFPHARAIEFLHRVDPESLKVPEEDAFKIGILPDAGGVYHYARPALHLSQVDDLLVTDPQGNEIKVEDALEAGYTGPFGSQQEYYYFSPVLPGETRVCELVSNGSKLRITTNNDENTAYEVAIADAYKYGFLPAPSGTYHYAGDLPYLRELDTNSNVLYDLLDKPVNRKDAEQHGYLRHNDGKYYYIGLANLPQKQSPPPIVEPSSSIDLCDSSFDNQSEADGINTTCADITLLYDKRIDIFIEKNTGYVVDNKAMLRDYGYLIDNTRTPHFVGINNLGKVLPHGTDMNTIDQSKTIITGYDNKMHLYDQKDIDAYYENNVAIVPKKIDIVKLQKRLETVNDPNQVRKLAEHMQRLDKRQLEFSQPHIRDISSCSSEKVSILIDDGVGKSTVLNVKGNELQDPASNALSKLDATIIQREHRQPKDVADDLIVEELVNAQAQPHSCLPACKSIGGISSSIVYTDPAGPAPKNLIDTLDNCTIINNTSLGAGLNHASTGRKAVALCSHNIDRELLGHKIGYSCSPDRAVFKRHGPGLVVTTYGSVDDTFIHMKGTNYRTHVLTPSRRGHIVIQNIIKPSPNTSIRPLFDRDAGIVFDGQTNEILGHVNEITGDIEDITGRTIGHSELRSRTIKYFGTEGSPREALMRAPIHRLRSTTVASAVTPLQRSRSHDPRHSVELGQEDYAFDELVETPLRTISTKAYIAMNTPTQIKSPNPPPLSSSVKGLSSRRNLIDPKSGRTTQGLTKSNMVLVTLHDPDIPLDLDPHAITTSQVNMHTETIPRGGSAPARGSFGLSDTGFKEDSIVSMHDGIFPGIDDRTRLGVTPTELVRATSHRVIRRSPSLIPGMHNPAPPSLNTLHKEGKTLNALSNTLPVTSQKPPNSTLHRTSSKHDTSIDYLMCQKPVRRAQSMRYVTGHMLPSMTLPHELLRRPYYKDATSGWIPYTQVTLVPDDSKMLSESCSAPLSILQSLAYRTLQPSSLPAKPIRPHTTNDASEATSATSRVALVSDEEDLVDTDIGCNRSPQVLPLMRYSSNSATMKGSAVIHMKRSKGRFSDPHKKVTGISLRGASNPVVSKQISCSLSQEARATSSCLTKGSECQPVQVDTRPPSNLPATFPPVASVVESTEALVPICSKHEHLLSKTNKPKETLPLNAAPPLPETKQCDTIYQPINLVTSRRLLSIQPKKLGPRQAHQPRIIQIVQDDLNTSASSRTHGFQAHFALDAIKELEASGLAINTSPRRRHQ